VAIALIGVLAAPALAEKGPKVSPATKKQAKAHFTKGQEYLAAGAYDDAIAEYLAAYHLLPIPELLFDLGQAHRLKGDKKKALEYYEKYLRAEPEGRGSEEARLHQSTLNREIAVEAGLAPPTQTPVQPAPTAQPFGPTRPPEPQQTAADPAVPPRPASATVEVTRRDPDPGAPDPVAPGGQLSTIISTNARHSTDTDGGATARRTWGYASAGVGGAGLLTGVITGILVLHYKSVVEQDCPASIWQGTQKLCMTTKGTDAASSGATASTINTVSWVVGLAGAGVGAYLLLTSPSSASGHPAPTTAAIAPAYIPGGAAMVATGHF
jgi:hypothetical protein